MAGTLTPTHQTHRTIKRLSLAWVSDSSGDVNSTTVDVVGELLRVVFVPDSGGTQPTDLYDVTLDDANSLDVLNGAGSNLSNTTSTQTAVGVTNGTDGNWQPAAVAGDLELKVSNAGSEKGGTVVLYYR